jgi:hypothetical protein
MSYKSVDIGKDMFLNDVVVGQNILYLRAAPGGIGIGEIIKIEVIDKRSGNIPAGWKYGYKHFKTKRMDIWYRFQLKTQNGRYTTKFFDEIIGHFDTDVYEQIKDE